MISASTVFLFPACTVSVASCCFWQLVEEAELTSFMKLKLCTEKSVLVIVKLTQLLIGYKSYLDSYFGNYNLFL